MSDEDRCTDGYDEHDVTEVDRDEDSVHWRCDRCGAEGFEAIEDWAD